MPNNLPINNKRRITMYGSGSILGLGITTAGIVALPNTGNNVLLAVMAMTSIVIGSLIVLSTVIRLIAKKVYKA